MIGGSFLASLLESLIGDRCSVEDCVIGDSDLV